MNAREVEASAHDLARRRGRIRDSLAFAAGCAVVALIAAPFALELATAFGAGALTGVAAAVFSVLGRQDRIAQLALDPLAHELPEVARYADRLTGQLERERLAQWIIEIVSEAAQVPDSWYLSGRVVFYANELAELGEALADPLIQIRPASAAALHLLLTQAVDSPLYNPAIPADHLAAIIANIRLGMTRAPAQPPLAAQPAVPAARRRTTLIASSSVSESSSERSRPDSFWIRASRWRSVLRWMYSARDADETLR
jgi:hypothetical protein